MSKIVLDLARIIVETALLPYQSWMNLDALLRSLYRRFVSHRHLLEWSTAQKTQDNAQTKAPKYLTIIASSGGISTFLMLLFLLFKPDCLLLVFPWLVLWLASPLMAWSLNRRPHVRTPVSFLKEDERRFLRKISRRTWRYFADFVNEKSSWLPPDNYQVSHQNQLAMRTSPTNIGLWLASVLSARQFGYLTGDDVTHTLLKTFGTLNQLERYEGHLLNWYDIQTLTPLNPRYVSTVDSGNFLGALWTLQHGLLELMHRPILDSLAFEGLCDTCEILKESAQQETYVGFDTQDIDDLLKEWNKPHAHVGEALAVLWKTKITVRNLAQKARGINTTTGNVTYWADQLENLIQSWLSVSDRYLNWIEILNEKNVAGIPALLQAPSLFDLARGQVPAIIALENMRHQTATEEVSLIDWFDRILTAFSKSKWLAGEALSVTEQLVHECDNFAEAINMQFLFNQERKLFSIGYNVS
ncbi:MAG TPA: glycosyl transferase, partial [bacterium]|nr:glycosyl transferase [bacterium]